MDHFAKPVMPLNVKHAQVGILLQMTPNLVLIPIAASLTVFPAKAQLNAKHVQQA